MKNVVIKQNYHSRGMLSGIPSAVNKQGVDPRLQASGMTSYLMSGSHLTYKEEALNKGSFRAPLRFGFTLIELLVVVLIIGILAAVAVPQYQKAVLRARYATFKSIAKSILLAERIFYLENGEFTFSMESLGLCSDISGVRKDTCTFKQGKCQIDPGFGTSTAGRVWCGSTDMRYVIDFVNQNTWCFTYNQDLTSLENKLCKGETGADSPDSTKSSGNWWEYAY